MAIHMPAHPPVPFAALTTLEIGGVARSLIEVDRPQQLPSLLRNARARHHQVFVLGGGSNLVVADSGFPGTVLRLRNCDWQIREESRERVEVRVGAGLEWDDLVALAVERGWAGIECLSGIPGRVGAAPIQNIGAYGQEVAQTIHAVEVVERSSGAGFTLPASDCGLGYRSSHFKGIWKDRYVVTGVCFSFRPDQPARPAYGDLLKRFPGRAEVPLAEMRQAVLDIRRSKSMVWDREDPNHRSAGSFFTNPIVDRAVGEALLAQHGTMPHFPAGLPDEGKMKLSAAWLIERSGFVRGYQRGRVGLSSNHVLALINLGGASASELLNLAGEVRRGVWQHFRVELLPEPEMLGFEGTLLDLMPLE
jgi:UDP-N-acetylmuramate dehydrogenase